MIVWEMFKHSYKMGPHKAQQSAMLVGIRLQLKQISSSFVLCLPYRIWGHTLWVDHQQPGKTMENNENNGKTMQRKKIRKLVEINSKQ